MLYGCYPYLSKYTLDGFYLNDDFPNTESTYQVERTFYASKGPMQSVMNSSEAFARFWQFKAKNLYIEQSEMLSETEEKYRKAPPKNLISIWLGKPIQPEDMINVLLNKKNNPNYKGIMIVSHLGVINRTLAELSAHSCNGEVRQEIQNFNQNFDVYTVKEILDLFLKTDYEYKDILVAAVNEEMSGTGRNYASASDILRIMSLALFGGVYHDVKTVLLTLPEDLCYLYGFSVSVDNTVSKSGRKENTASLGNEVLCGGIQDEADKEIFNFLLRKLARFTTPMLYKEFNQEAPDYAYINWPEFDSLQQSSEEKIIKKQIVYSAEQEKIKQQLALRQCKRFLSPLQIESLGKEVNTYARKSLTMILTGPGLISASIASLVSKEPKYDTRAFFLHVSSLAFMKYSNELSVFSNVSVNQKCVHNAHVIKENTGSSWIGIDSRRRANSI